MQDPTNLAVTASFRNICERSPINVLILTSGTAMDTAETAQGREKIQSLRESTRLATRACSQS